MTHFIKYDYPHEAKDLVEILQSRGFTAVVGVDPYNITQTVLKVHDEDHRIHFSHCSCVSCTEHRVSHDPVCTGSQAIARQASKLINLIDWGFDDGKAN